MGAQACKPGALPQAFAWRFPTTGPQAPAPADPQAHLTFSPVLKRGGGSCVLSPPGINLLTCTSGPCATLQSPEPQTGMQLTPMGPSRGRITGAPGVAPPRNAQGSHTHATPVLAPAFVVLRLSHRACLLFKVRLNARKQGLPPKGMCVHKRAEASVPIGLTAQCSEASSFCVSATWHA